MKLLLLCVSILYFNIALLAQPIASFMPDRFNVCSGTTVLFTNTSIASNAYTWLIEGQLYSTNKDLLATLVEPCYELTEIKLIARDTTTGFSDSNTMFIEVFDSCFFHWNGDFLKCIGDTVEFSKFSEEIATEFIISPPHTLLSGCLTCDSIKFILAKQGTQVDRKSTYKGGCSEITTYHYLCSMGIHDENKKEQIKFYPNPVSQILLAEADNQIYSIRIYDLIGQIVLSKDIINNFVVEIDVSGLNRGIYIVSAILKSGMIINQQIIKK